jgi:hypothetical protein
MRDHLRKGLLAVFAGGPHYVWCPKTRWSPPLGASIALKIGKNELETKKLQLPKVRGVILIKILDQTGHSLFLIPSKNLQILICCLHL